MCRVGGTARILLGDATEDHGNWLISQKQPLLASRLLDASDADLKRNAIAAFGITARRDVVGHFPAFFAEDPVLFVAMAKS